MLWRTQHLVDQAALDDAAEIHDGHLMRQIVDHREVMRDEQVGQPEVVLQCLEQIENLRLDRDVKRRGRLVANDQLRLDSQCTRNGYALPLATGKLMRVAACGRWASDRSRSPCRSAASR